MRFRVFTTTALAVLSFQALALIGCGDLEDSEGTSASAPSGELELTVRVIWESAEDNERRALVFVSAISPNGSRLPLEAAGVRIEDQHETPFVPTETECSEPRQVPHGQMAYCAIYVTLEVGRTPRRVIYRTGSDVFSVLVLECSSRDEAGFCPDPGMECARGGTCRPGPVRFREVERFAATPFPLVRDASEMRRTQAPLRARLSQHRAAECTVSERVTVSQVAPAVGSLRVAYAGSAGILLWDAPNDDRAGAVAIDARGRAIDGTAREFHAPGGLLHFAAPVRVEGGWIVIGRDADRRHWAYFLADGGPVSGGLVSLPAEHVTVRFARSEEGIRISRARSASAGFPRRRSVVGPWGPWVVGVDRSGALAQSPHLSAPPTAPPEALEMRPVGGARAGRALFERGLSTGDPRRRIGEPTTVEFADCQGGATELAFAGEGFVVGLACRPTSPELIGRATLLQTRFVDCR